MMGGGESLKAAAMLNLSLIGRGVVTCCSELIADWMQRSHVLL